jgi:hypothetical protein
MAKMARAGAADVLLHKSFPNKSGFYVAQTKIAEK